jgi:hypothetical protein
MDSPSLPPDVQPKKEDNENGLKMEKLRWKNRRRMAWVSVCSMVLETAVLIYIAAFTTVDMTRFNTIAEPLSWSYFGFLSVVGAYMGFTTWASRK